MYVVLCRHCIFEHTMVLDFEPVLVTVSYLLEYNPAAQFWCTYQVRKLVTNNSFTTLPIISSILRPIINC